MHARTGFDRMATKCEERTGAEPGRQAKLSGLGSQRACACAEIDATVQWSAAAVDHLVVLAIDRKPVVHLTARVARSVGNLDDPEIARWLWARLRAAFPDALAATLMPDHPHVVTPHEDPGAAVVRLHRLLGQLGRKLGLGERAGIAAPARVVDSVAELSRQLRYVGLNAPRKGLVECPLAWPWSSHRDAVGAIADPWIPASRLAAALGDGKPRFVERYHAYVSADPSCDVAGTPAHVPAATAR